MTRTIAKPPLRLGFFTRLLDQADAAERYRLATAQIMHAERCGFDSAWVAQHHFHEDEGGLPAPFVFLSQVAARTTRIRLGTGIVTLPLELPVRVAEDAAVLDLMCGGRLEVGIGPGGNLSAYDAFGQRPRWWWNFGGKRASGGMPHYMEPGARVSERWSPGRAKVVLQHPTPS